MKLCMCTYISQNLAKQYCFPCEQNKACYEHSRALGTAKKHEGYIECQSKLNYGLHYILSCTGTAGTSGTVIFCTTRTSVTVIFCTVNMNLPEYF